jgi:hypothetical protein
MGWPPSTTSVAEDFGGVAGRSLRAALQQLVRFQRGTPADWYMVAGRRRRSAGFQNTALSGPLRAP